jgi:cobalt-zinc-cadmium efflux system outer membrane protein
VTGTTRADITTTIMTTDRRFSFALSVAAAVIAFGESPAIAQECSTLDRTNVVSCAIAASHGVRAEEHGVDAARAHFTAASTIFPSNPTLLVTGGRRTNGPDSTYNWSVALGQEIEIAGQRGARRSEASDLITAANNKLLVSERDVAANALRAYYDALAANRALDLAKRLETNAAAVASAARARANNGLVPTVEADVADAGALRATQLRLDVAQHVVDSSSTLASIMGRAPTDAVIANGDLAPLPAAEAAAKTTTPAEARPEVAELDAQRKAFEDHASLLRRSRVPNVTISAFVQNDAFNDRVIGMGLAVPIPLPSPIGKTNAGEIAQAEAEAARAKSEVARITRELELRRALAASAYETSKTKLSAYSPDRIANAERQLAAIAHEVEAGQLGLRDAFVTQQVLVDLLQAHLEAERAVCLASVDLARASGFPIESR